jgi:C4-dicarboxylate-specific signal transduction histidine kinase
VISYIDITRRRRAEDEAHRQREELAHAQRITTLGELSASLAHEVNQPLAAIVTNAQAAIRLLERAGVEHADVSEALTDMAADAQRASAIIRRLRALSRKEPTSQKGVDLNETIVEGSFGYGVPHPGIYVMDPRGVVRSKYFEEKYQERDAARER